MSVAFAVLNASLFNYPNWIFDMFHHNKSAFRWNKIYCEFRLYHARFLLVKFTHFLVVARVSQVGIRSKKKTCKCRKFSNIVAFLCCRRTVLLNYKTSFPCEKPRVFQSDLNISQILTNFYSATQTRHFTFFRISQKQKFFGNFDCDFC